MKKIFLTLFALTLSAEAFAHGSEDDSDIEITFGDEEESDEYDDTIGFDCEASPLAEGINPLLLIEAILNQDQDIHEKIQIYLFRKGFFTLSNPNQPLRITPDQYNAMDAGLKHLFPGLQISYQGGSAADYIFLLGVTFTNPLYIPPSQRPHSKEGNRGLSPKSAIFKAKKERPFGMLHKG